MIKFSHFTHLIYLSLCTVHAANASLTGPTTVDFSNSGYSAYYGTANTAFTDTSANTCGVKSLGCYVQNGVAIGVVSDPSNFDNHFHLNSGGIADGGLVSGQAAETLSDSNGLYIRLTDGSAFSLQSMLFSAANTASVAINPIYGANPATNGNGILTPDGSNKLGPDEYWQIFGFNTAVNPNLSTQDTNLYQTLSQLQTEYPTLVAYQTVPNGFNSALTLNSGFDDVNAVWIHYYGYPDLPQNGIAFRAYIDNIDVGAPSVFALPLPSGFWLFTVGLPFLVRRRR